MSKIRVVYDLKGTNPTDQADMIVNNEFNILTINVDLPSYTVTRSDEFLTKAKKYSMSATRINYK